MSRKETMKVYHGIPKSITDEHTIFYLNDNNNILINASRSHRTPVSVGYTDFKGTDGFVCNTFSLYILSLIFQKKGRQTYSPTRDYLVPNCIYPPNRNRNTVYHCVKSNVTKKATESTPSIMPSTTVILFITDSSDLDLSLE